MGDYPPVEGLDAKPSKQQSNMTDSMGHILDGHGVLHNEYILAPTCGPG